jgi:DNA-binding transcriptional regulator YiaG
VTTSVPGKRFQPTYVARRSADGWQLVDARDGQVLEQFPPGPVGAEQADAAASAANRPRSAPAFDLRAWRRRQDLTQKELGVLLGVFWITVQRWETGFASMPPYLHLALERLEQLQQLEKEPQP